MSSSDDSLRAELARLLDDRAREARLLETIQENTRAHLAYLDRDFNFVRANSAYVAGCGHSLQELIGRNHFHFFPDPENQAIFERCRDTGQPAEYLEKPFQYADQPERGITYWDWTLTPVKDDAGEVEGLVLSLMDVTDRVRARERALAAERARAEMAETMAAEINHRMKNNLGMVAGLLQMQLAAQPQDGPGAYLVRDAVARILTIAEVHSQLYDTGSDTLDLLQAVRNIADIGRQALGRESVQISVHGAPFGCPSRGATSLCVCVNELITNALKHGAPTPRGPLEIEVGLAPGDAKLALSVWNSGNPIPTDLPLESGPTMGLRLVREIVTRQHQGSFTLRPDRGGTRADIIVEAAHLH